MKALLLLFVIAACSESKQPEPKREPERQRRVIEPQSRGVRALPPHAIRADGVGPYKLGATVRELLDQLPSGPRITQFTLPDVIQRDILRAEDDAILIGTEPQGTAKFVSVVRSEIARTEAGVHVGSTTAELERSLGAPLEEAERAQDPRLVIPSNLKNARVLLDGDRARIEAIVIATEAERPKEAAAEKRDYIVRQTGEDMMLIARESEKPTTAPVRVPGLVFAAPLRNPNDSRDDIVAITRTEDGQIRTWSLVVLRPHEGKLLRLVEQTVYKLTADNARWIGADIDNLELFLELTSRADSIEVGGLLTTRISGKLRDIVVITPVNVPRRRAKAPAHDPIDAGTSDAH